MSLEPGTRFDRYVVQELLGEGGMGKVYRAFDDRLRRRVALKILGQPSGDATMSASVTSILREARAAAALDHPNVVAVFDLGEHEGTSFIAMELVVGRPLRALVGRAEVPIERRIGWLADVAKALGAAHRAGVVHRDIKPENVMVREDSVVKVLDFGVARQATIDIEPASRTALGAAALVDPADPNGTSGQLAGTPAYMAPEQVRAKPIDGRSDQFAWGVLAYELLAGRLPWSATATLFDVIHCVVNEDPAPLRERNPEVPEAVSAVVMRALSKEPGDRFATMNDLLDALAPDDAARSSLNALPSPRSSEPSSAGATDVTVTVSALEEALSKESGSARTPKPSQSAVTLPSVPPPPDDAEAPTERAGAAESPRAPPRRASISRVALSLVGAVLVGATVTGAALGLWPRAGPEIPPPKPPLAAPTGTSLLNLPPPSGCNAAASAAHKQGVRALHDGNWEQAHASFEQATTADQGCASAYFRLTMTGYYTYPISRTREVYKRALDLRAGLSERDQLVLDAFEPRVRREPSDEHEFRARLRAVAARFPTDAEVSYLAASEIEDLDARIVAVRRALAIDPRYSDALQVLGRALRMKGRTSEALAAFDDCARVAQNSVDCLRERSALLDGEGRCAELAVSARLWIARDPSTAEGYLALAHGLAAQDTPKAAVEEALRQRWARLAEPERQRRQLFEQALLDALFGDLESAEQLARTLAKLVDADPNLEPHVRPPFLLVDILREQSRGADAGRVAADFLARKGAWSANVWPRHLDVAVHLVEPRFLHAARLGGAISAPEWRAARSTWLTSIRSSDLFEPELLWAVDAAAAASTPAEATEALTTAPPSLLPDAGSARTPAYLADAFGGHALLLAGRRGEALQLLRAAAVSCHALSDPFVLTRAQLWLGQALEAEGDAPAACSAYQVVLRRWGRAKPRSETAELAKKRVEALSCRR